jgi:hypothetical protein
MASSQQENNSSNIVDANDFAEEYLNHSRSTRQLIENIMEITQIHERHLYHLLRRYRDEPEVLDIPNTRRQYNTRINLEDTSSDDCENPLSRQLSREERHTTQNLHRRTLNSPIIRSNRPQTARGLSARFRNQRLTTQLSSRQPQRSQTSMTFSRPILSTSNFENLLNLSPVNIRPTLQQIENATEIIRFANIDNPINRRCPITQDEFDENHMVTQIIHCKHLFNTESLERWFTSNTRCPLCRYDIRNYHPMNEIRNPYSQRDICANRVQINANNHEEYLNNLATFMTDDIINRIQSDLSLNPLGSNESISVEYNLLNIPPSLSSSISSSSSTITESASVMDFSNNRVSRTFISMNCPDDTESDIIHPSPPSSPPPPRPDNDPR